MRLSFSSFMDHNPVLPVIQYLKTVVSHILDHFLMVDSQRASLIPVTLLELIGEMQSLFGEQFNKIMFS